MAIEKDLLDQLLAGRDPKGVFSKDYLLDGLRKALSERISSKASRSSGSAVSWGVAQNGAQGHSAGIVLNILARHREPPPPLVPEALRCQHRPGRR